MYSEIELLRKESVQLIEKNRELQRELALAFGWNTKEEVPKDWHKEADQKKLWKMFR